MLELVEFSREWAEPYYDMLQEASDTDMIRIGLESRMSREEIQAAFAAPSDGRWDRLVIRDGSRLVGDVNLFFNGGTEDGLDRSAEVNVFVREGERRSGAATVALRGALSEAGKRGLVLIKAIIDAENEAGKQLFERNGFKFIQRLGSFCQLEYHLSLASK